MTDWIFEYKAIFSPYTQRIISGTVQAVSAEEAESKVKEMGYTPTSITAFKPVTILTKDLD